MMAEPLAVELIKHGRQFFNKGGDECFYAVATGRRPDVSDSLLVIGVGITREHALSAAESNWHQAYQSLQSTAAVGKKHSQA